MTRPGEAAACADNGADAIGVVFFPKSPRNVTPDQARAVVAAIPESVGAVGVFVNAGFSRAAMEPFAADPLLAVIFLRGGADAFVSKPIDGPSLVRTIKGLLAKR